MNMFYPIAIEAGDHEHAYGVIVPDLPGCFSAGDTLDEAIKNAKEAITGHIELCVELGHEILPCPPLRLWPRILTIRVISGHWLM